MFELLIAVVVVVLIFRSNSKRKRRNRYDPGERLNWFDEEVNPRTTGEYWHTKPLSVVEQKMYWRLHEAIGTEKVILSQVAFSSFIRTKGEKRDRWALWGKMKQKVADFVICNRDFSLNCIIELDDSSHSEEKDALRDEATRQAGIRTLRFRATDIPSIEVIRKAVLSEQDL